LVVWCVYGEGAYTVRMAVFCPFARKAELRCAHSYVRRVYDHACRLEATDLVHDALGRTERGLARLVMDYWGP
jgi:hypothetical protein